MISHGASDGELCKQQVKAAECTPITLYTFQMENILCGSGWMTSCSLSGSEGFGHTVPISQMLLRCGNIFLVSKPKSHWPS
jgi:hypothetical protein